MRSTGTRVRSSRVNQDRDNPALKAVWNNLYNWLEGYFWLPLSLLLIIGAAKYVHFLTGRPSVESPDWIVGFSYRFVACIAVILLCSIMREATGIWLTKEEQKVNVVLACAQRFTTCFFAALFTYLLLH